MPNPKFLSKDDVLRAMRMTRSNRGAARYSLVAYNTYKKFAKLYRDEETGKSLWELHMNMSGKGIPKSLTSKGERIDIQDLMEGKVPIDHFTPTKIKQIILREGILEEKCAICGFNERRVVDTKVPLVLHHLNGNNRDYRRENLELLCYNCSFLYAVSPITDKQVEKMEDYVEHVQTEAVDWELDEYHIQHLRELGLYDEEKKPGEEYISRI